ncbi:glycosyltransferase family 2 protein [Aequorivita sp. F47161]|uniref:Glycosyltransferase family 2 protein n=1 Tax=Aequorivita vitellina TaxID=2874475 RepID=A0A9X1QXX2_9FLAO|nr:glycosyltransferase family A protein [Aequorivita vitellina]MCG2419881.1 glycosyltransferase family 2 protein [Aequorivita vitellina]
MRTGINPQKAEGLLELTTNHRIVMVVFIPELKGYYSDMFEVIKVSISSLINSIPRTSAITIVDNGSCGVTTDYIMSLYKEGVVDTIQMHKENIGKIDALMGAARTAREPIITLTDCDILFKKEWVMETIKIFNSFQNVGSVSPIPVRRSVTYYTFSGQEAILRKKLKFSFTEIPENFEDYNRFLQSINWDLEKSNKFLWPVVEENGNCAIMGSDHQVLTIRRDILFKYTPHNPSFTKVGKESEREYVDLAVDLSGKLRLSTYNYFAIHMGNKLEDWMRVSANEISNKNPAYELKLNPEIEYIKPNQFYYKLKKMILKRIFKFILPQKDY